LRAVEFLARAHADTIGSVIQDALTAYLSQEKPLTVKSGSLDNDSEVASKGDARSRLTALLLASAPSGEDVDTSVRQRVTSDLLIIGHHPLVCWYRLYYSVYRSLI
jgi:hypothetical protein